MKPAKTLKAILTLLTLTSLTITLNPNIIKNTQASPDVTVYISPQENSHPPTQKFNITVNIKDADRIHSWILDVLWNPNILNCTAILEGPWTNQGGTLKTYFDYYLNNTIGLARLTNTIQGQYLASGSGVLAILTFQVLQPGLTKLDLNRTKLIKRYFPSGAKEDIYPPETDGYFQYPKTILTITPDEIFQAQGLSFTTNITAINVYNLTTWIINFTWNPMILNLTQVQESPWNTSSPTKFNYTINNQEGKVTLNSTLQTSSGETGNRTLAILTFQVLGKGTSTLNIATATLLDINKIPHITTIIPGTFFSAPKLSTKPSSIIDKTLIPGTQVNLTLTIANVENLNTWNVNLAWNPSILKLIEALEGPFLSSQGTTNFTYIPNQQEGIVQLSCNLAAEQGVNGTGVLAILEFNVTMGGKFKFNITNSSLKNRFMEEIVHVVEGTEFDNTLRDIAVTNVQTSKQTVEQNEIVTITTTVLNNGTIPESITLTIKFGRAVIYREIIQNIQPLASRNVTLDYNVENLPADIYEIKARIDYLIGEEDYTNNAKSTIITIQAKGFTPGLEIIAAIIIVLIIAIAGVTFFILRRPKKAEG